MTAPRTEPLEALAAEILQVARHRADYDHTAAFSRTQVRLLIGSSRRAVDLLPTLAGDRHFELYLRLLLDGPGLVKRSR